MPPGRRALAGRGGAPGEAGPDGILDGQHAADDEDHGDEVHRTEALAEERDAEQDADHRVDEADDRG